MIKIFEQFNEIKPGDMVYVNAFGPATYGFGANGYVRQSDKPFRPQMWDFNKDTQYEVVAIEGNKAILFDDNNEVVDMPLDRVSKTKFE